MCVIKSNKYSSYRMSVQSSDEMREMLLEFYSSADGTDHPGMENFFGLLQSLLTELKEIGGNKEIIKVLEKEADVNRIKDMADQGRKLLRENPDVLDQVMSMSGVKVPGVGKEMGENTSPNVGVVGKGDITKGKSEINNIKKRPQEQIIEIPQLNG